MEWQDIESAPRDGTIIDLWCPSINRRAPNMCWRPVAHGNAQYEGWTNDWYGRGSLFDARQFSHWMPLPDAPKAAPEQEPRSE